MNADRQCEDSNDDDPKQHLIAADPEEPRRSLDAPAAECTLMADAPIWRLKRLRPAFLSIGILACLTACLTACACLVPDVVRELHNQAGDSGSRQLIGRLISPHGQCVAIGNGAANASSSSSSSSSSFHFNKNTSAAAAAAFRCAAAPIACDDQPALCRYLAGLFACQVATPVCLLACLCLLALAVCAVPAARLRATTWRRLLLAALAFACAGLAFTVAFIACLHVLVAVLSASVAPAAVHQSNDAHTHYSSSDTHYSADTTGARIAYGALCLQAVLVCQLACLPAWLRRVSADRDAMLAWIKAE